MPHSFSMRERENSNHSYFEWEVLAGLSYYDLWSIDVGYERESDQYWYILKSNGTKYKLFAGLDGEYQIVQQGEIDRQSLMLGKHWKSVGILVGATTQRWSPQATEGAYTFKVPLYWGEYKYVTDFHEFRQHEAKFMFPKDVKLYYIKLNWYQERGVLYRKLKVGYSPYLVDLKNLGKLFRKGKGYE